MSIVIRPYIHCDGIPTFRDSDLLNLFDLMCRDKTDKIVFMDGHIKCGNDFVTFIKSGAALTFVAMNLDDPAGFGYLTHFENRTARAHFCIFSKYWGNGSIDIGKKLVSKAIESTGLDMLIGMIPEFNTKAIDFSLKCGAKLLGVLPFGSTNQSGSYPTTVLYYTR
jgi:hypothetical protein